MLAVGNPFGLGGTVTAGIVSANGRDIGAGPYDDFIQIDAPVNRGNSGGPTFDVNGNVIGVNTAIFSPSGGNVGIAFAIPASTVRSVVAQLRDRGSVTRGWIGVQIQPVTAEIAESLNLKSTQGALVAEPQAGSPAVTAGIRAGDIITQVNGTPVRDARELARTIGAMPPNTSVRLTRAAQRRRADRSRSRSASCRTSAKRVPRPSSASRTREPKCRGSASRWRRRRSCRQRQRRRRDHQCRAGQHRRRARLPQGDVILEHRQQAGRRRRRKSAT